MRKKIFILLSVLYVLFTQTFLSYAAGKDTAIDGRIEEFKEKTGCKNVSVVIVDNDDTFVYGDEDALYQIGSMTKAFTGLAILKLEKDGALSDDDRISDILNGYEAYFEGEACDITIRQLLTHTSGYTNEESVYPSASKDMSLMEWAYSVSGKELEFKPSEGYAYSNVNYNLLGAVIEKVSGMSYEEYMYSFILTPLGLKCTYVQAPLDKTDIVSGSRIGYRYAFRYDIPVYEGKIPAGYFYSGASDMERWIRIWLGTEDIPDEYRELIDTVKKNLCNEGDYYSGWELFEDGMIGHSGGTPNYSSRIVFSDKEGIGVCVLTNMNVAASTDSLCNAVFDIASGKSANPLKGDVWTVFDMVFLLISLAGALFILITVITEKRRVILSLLIFVIILLTSICITMPLVFGAGLKEIAFVWAPYSFTGGLIILLLEIPVGIIKLWKTKKDENREKTG